MKWVVILVKQPIVNDFRDDYFPRKFHYKKDAQELVNEVKTKGGFAIIMRGTR